MPVQIVTSRLKSDTVREECLALTEQLLGWLQGRDGFVT